MMFFLDEDYNSEAELLTLYTPEDIRELTKRHEAWTQIEIDKNSSEYQSAIKNNSVKYEGFLVNHSKKQAIDLAAYYQESLSRSYYYDFVIDPIAALTETGCETEMTLYHGMSGDTTEYLVDDWCGDILQIVASPCTLSDLPIVCNQLAPIKDMY